VIFKWYEQNIENRNLILDGATPQYSVSQGSETPACLFTMEQLCHGWIK